VDIEASVTSDAQTLERLLANRYSCRGFLPEPVADSVIERILGMAQRSPSWCNAQPWQVIVTKGEATGKFRAALHTHVTGAAAAPDIAFPREYHGPYLARRRACGFALYDAVGVKRGDRAASAVQMLENYRFFGAPHVAIITTDEALGTYGAVDCGAYVSTFLLAAQSLGVATIPQAALASHSKFVRDYFAIGEDRLVVCGISFGYEDRSHKANGFRTERAALDEAVRFVDNQRAAASGE
jgi:nitroreductase